MEAQETSTEPVRSHPLLWAIVEFRETLDRLIDEQKGLVLSRAADAVADEPAPVPSPTPSPPSARAALTEMDPAPARRFSSQGSRAWQKESPPPPATVLEPADPHVASEPARPEDARQRLDALAAKLSDRRMKQTPVDPSSRAGDG